MKHLRALPFLALFFSACMGSPMQEGFIQNLMPMCGQSYGGKVVSTDAVDKDWREAALIAGPVICEPGGIKMPLAVRENRSRTWVLIPERGRLTLKHDHRHKDGTPDAVSWYGGTSQGKDAKGNSALRQEFPVDEFSIALFKKEGLPASVTNTWAMDIVPGERFAYELSRPATQAQIAAGEPGRFFRLEFDLTAPLDAPSPQQP